MFLLITYLLPGESEEAWPSTSSFWRRLGSIAMRVLLNKEWFVDFLWPEIVESIKFHMRKKMRFIVPSCSADYALRPTHSLTHSLSLPWQVLNFISHMSMVLCKCNCLTHLPSLDKSWTSFSTWIWCCASVSARLLPTFPPLISLELHSPRFASEYGAVQLPDSYLPSLPWYVLNFIPHVSHVKMVLCNCLTWMTLLSASGNLTLQKPHGKIVWVAFGIGDVISVGKAIKSVAKLSRWLFKCWVG